MMSNATLVRAISDQQRELSESLTEPTELKLIACSKIVLNQAL